jgi:hypothetical protein
MTSPRLPLVKAQRSFLSGIRLSREQHGPKVIVKAQRSFWSGIHLSREQHGPKVKVTAPPKKNGSSELSGF